MKFVDLFCGVGGTSYGATSVGLKPHLLVDSNPDVKKILSNDLAKNFVPYDLTNVGLDFIEVIGEADALFCSPPCQNYSKLKTRNSEATAMVDDLSFANSISKIVENADFDIIMVENVPSFLKSGAAIQIVDTILRKGFHVCAGVFDAASFGVPQRRKRSVILATRRPRQIGIVGTVSSIRNAFQNLPEINSVDALHCNHRRHSQLVMERIASIPKNGGSRSSLPEHLVLNCHKKTNGYRDIYGRMSWNKPSPTITSGCTNPSKGRFLHPEENRAITLREAARLQTLPDSLDLSALSSEGKKAQMIGNAFPSKMVAEILLQSL